MAMLITLKGLPLAYNSDLQEDKERVFDALDALKPSLDLIAKLWPSLEFDKRAMREAAGGWSLATDLAEYLVKRGVPFREAHDIVGSIVRDAAAAGRSIAQLTLAELRNRSRVFAADAIDILSPERSIAARRAAGGPSPAAVRRRIAELSRK
jgi:argininosuccinate lyase